jgi:hypothetical protein
MSWIVPGGVAFTAFLGWWWTDAVAALGLVYFNDDSPSATAVYAFDGDFAAAITASTVTPN